MKQTILGKTGLKISRMGFGGIPIQRIDAEGTKQLVQKMIQEGINYIDTARGYTVSEAFLGEALEGVRDKFILATKSMARTKDAMAADIDISLKNLRTDHIDLYQVHNPTLEQLEQVNEKGGALEALQEAVASGKIGHIGVTECIKLAKRAEKYNIAWIEDMLPWQMTEGYKRLAAATCVPLCTGEDIYLKENFIPLLESGALGVIHPDILSTGGILETKKIGDMAQDHGVAMAIHMAETPIAFMAAAHTATATENFLALEFHSVDIPWWQDLVEMDNKPLIKNGFVEVPDAPGLGIKGLNDEVIREHMHSSEKDIWLPTDAWDKEWSHDRLWS